MWRPTCRTIAVATLLLAPAATPYEGAYWAVPYYDRGEYFEGHGGDHNREGQR
jgi:hypothetical protein